jgi:hypothetical protein
MRRWYLGGAAMLAAVATSAGAQQRGVLPTGLEPQTRLTIEQLADSLRSAGLPTEPIYAKAAEGKLKQATDAQIIGAVRSLARRFGEIRAALGRSIDDASMSAAATAFAAGVPLPAIRGLSDAAGVAGNAGGDFATALVTVTDLVSHGVASPFAVTAVQSLLARRASVEQYTRLRMGVMDDILAGRSPDQAVRTRSDAIVRSLPATPPVTPGTKPPA